MIMKRRNEYCGKLRRLPKRSKLAEGIYGSTFLYVKFLMVWALVLMADFILDFRFEYLWPFWLLLRSVYDSFKYQGLAFSVFFVCIAITSDVICYLIIPVQWLFFAASTYVWVQYVWHTDRGVCLPTVSLWLLFVYIEGSVRLREFKTILPFHLDLCRPFAAHCIGYPVVTLGFGFKSYVSYRLRTRRQKDVQKENAFYKTLLQQALPLEANSSDKQKALSSKSQEDTVSNGVSASTNPPINSLSSASRKSVKSDSDSKKQNNNSSSASADDYYIEHSSTTAHRRSVNEFEPDESSPNEIHSNKTYKTNGLPIKSSAKLVQKESVSLNTSTPSSVPPSKRGRTNTANGGATNCSAGPAKEDVIPRLESDIKRLKADLQNSRNTEQELRSQVSSLSQGDKLLKSELFQLRQDNESLQSKVHNLVTNRQQDKQSLSSLEKRLQDERKAKSSLEQQLTQEKKSRRNEENNVARATAAALAARTECTENCKSRARELEKDLQHYRREMMVRQEKLSQLENEIKPLRQYRDTQNETDVLMSALAAMQDKNSHLENNLSAETRVKLDLFSALGDAKRRLEILQSMMVRKDQEVTELKSRLGEVISLLPSSVSAPFSVGLAASGESPSPLYSTDSIAASSSLNPNASDYTPLTSDFLPMRPASISHE